METQEEFEKGFKLDPKLVQMTKEYLWLRQELGIYAAGDALSLLMFYRRNGHPLG